MSHELLLATHNAGKVREIRQMSGAGVRWRSLAEFPGVGEAPEAGRTFAENARQKALFYAAATGLPTLADDSGLEVAALDGEPGVDSAIYAGEPRSDEANNRKLIANLAGMARRDARFRCCMAFVRDGQVVCESEGTIEGRIVDEPRGANGFGYDPHFLSVRHGRTLAELDPAAKNEISHRGQALRAILGRILGGA